MPRPSYSAPTIASGQENWDADVQDGLDQVETILAEPFPLPEHSGDETDLESTFAAADYARCLIYVDHSTLGWKIYHSDGTSWSATSII